MFLTHLLFPESCGAAAKSHGLPGNKRLVSGAACIPWVTQAFKYNKADEEDVARASKAAKQHWATYLSGQGEVVPGVRYESW